ncbi:MAG TPA: tyrosine--tRNA ligase, partial [Rhodanobacteraceae bacterium]|nr:tyrosine--tRNA ligase [Rhodanobacteraceae bacterium]
SDQLFNLLFGREIQRAYGQEPQDIAVFPLLEGLDGVQKMSKSLGNYIGIDEPAIDMVTKTMKIGDDLMWRWFELLSFEVSLDALAEMKREVAGGVLNPRDAKLRLARELAARFHGAAEAEKAVAGWHAVVRGEGDTSSLPLNDIVVPAEGLRLPALLTAAGLTSSNSEANRKLKERAVRVDAVVAEDPQRVFEDGFEGVLQVGKRNFARVRLVRA